MISFIFGANLCGKPFQKINVLFLGESPAAPQEQTD